MTGKRKTPVKCSNDLEASRVEHPFFECSEESRNFEEFNLGCEQSVTAKNPASIMTLGVVTSNGKKMPPVLFERG